MQKPTYNDLNTWLEHAIQERDHLSVKVETLQDDLEKTRKALDVAVDALKSAHEYYEYCIQRDKDYDSDDINWDCTAMNMDNDISEALEQITALEQKDNGGNK